MKSPKVSELVKGALRDASMDHICSAVPEHVQQVVEEAVKDVVWLDIVTVFMELRYSLLWRK